MSGVFKDTVICWIIFVSLLVETIFPQYSAPRNEQSCKQLEIIDANSEITQEKLLNFLPYS